MNRVVVAVGGEGNGDAFVDVAQGPRAARKSLHRKSHFGRKLFVINRTAIRSRVTLPMFSAVRLLLESRFRELHRRCESVNGDQHSNFRLVPVDGCQSKQ